MLQAIRNRSKGLAFEKRVARLYKRLGKWRVRRDVKLHDGYGNLSQIDVVYGLFSPVYVECKNYGSKPVPLSDVAKFKEVLTLNGIPLHRGIFITNSTFVPRAETIGIKTINGQRLKRLESYSRLFALFRRIIQLGILGSGGFYLWNNWSEEMLTVNFWVKEWNAWNSQILVWKKQVDKWIKDFWN